MMAPFVVSAVAVVGAVAGALALAWLTGDPHPQCNHPGCDRPAVFAATDGGPGGHCPLHAEAL